jgi:hypothetical protein
MDAFAQARQFGDVGALRNLSSSRYLALVEDSARVRYGRFRASSPAGGLTPKDTAFRRFVTEMVPDANERTFETLATAYRLIERGDKENEAALVILAYVYQFPSDPIVISNSSYTFARGDSSEAVYYLSEDWVIPFGGGTIQKRFVVEWFRSVDGRWVLNRVR